MEGKEFFDTSRGNERTDPLIKSPWAAIDFSLASITPTLGTQGTRFVYGMREYRRNLLRVCFSEFR